MFPDRRKSEIAQRTLAVAATPVDGLDDAEASMQPLNRADEFLLLCSRRASHAHEDFDGRIKSLPL